ncbi:MAG: hypothetical protein AB7E47_15460 [Desulfovibrionaceae bacterium]
MSSLRIICLIIAAALLLAACGKSKQLETTLQYEPLQNATALENERLIKLRATEQKLEAPAPAPTTDLEPMPPAFNPLEEIPITLTMQNETLHNVLYVVARNAGLNLVIDPEISLENTITISFVQTPSSVVVNKLLKAYDLGWEVEDNTLFVKRFVDKTFLLEFLNTKYEATLDNGGDIYGTLSGAGTGGLKGDFNMKATLGIGIEEEDSLYKFLALSVEHIIEGGKDGTPVEGEYYALDPIAGSLYVRCAPTKMAAVDKLITELKLKLSKQILIDARILQVTLSDEFRLGVQWSAIFEKMAGLGSGSIQWGSSHTIPPTSLASNTAVVPTTEPVTIASFGRTANDVTIAATIDALKTYGGVKAISNPHIRARHGQPALITSGTTQRYISEITQTTTDTATNYSTTQASAFTGIMLGVYPFINDNNDVDLLVFPIKSNSDLSTTADVNGNTITLPRTEVQNVSTSIRVQSGATVILGGLIENDHSNSDQGVPGAMDVPLLGWLFKQKVKTEEVKELVIIMRIQVI